MAPDGNPVPDTLFVFIDESGNFDFSPKGTRHFVMAAVAALAPLDSAAEMQSLRYRLLAGGIDVAGFHAAEDRQSTRDAVFNAFARISTVRTHVIHGAKQEVGPDLRTDAALHSLFGQALVRFAIHAYATTDYRQVVVIFDQALTRKKQAIFHSTVKPQLKKHVIHCAAGHRRQGANPLIPISTLRLLIAGQVALCIVAFALAGSDLPPQRGFIVVVLGALPLAAVAGYGVKWPVRWMSGPGWAGALGRSGLAGGGLGAVLAILVVIGTLAAPRSPSEASLPDAAIFIAVCAVLAAVSAVLLSLVIICSSRARTILGALAISHLPTVLVVVPALLVVAVRATG